MLIDAYAVQYETGFAASPAPVFSGQEDEYFVFASRILDAALCRFKRVLSRLQSAL
jgi:hypothetical protein